MTRGVKREGWSAEVFRSRTYRRIRGVEHYQLRFTYHEGDAHINVAFRGEVPFDVINVYDYEHGKPRISSKREVKREIDEYMAPMSADDLRAHWENSRPKAGA
jgi:hypothetical protein